MTATFTPSSLFKYGLTLAKNGKFPHGANWRHTCTPSLFFLIVQSFKAETVAEWQRFSATLHQRYWVN